MKRFIILILALAQLSLGERLTLVVENQANQAGYSQTLTLNQGDSASLIFWTGSARPTIVCSIGTKSFEMSPSRSIAVGYNGIAMEGINPVAIAGPATVVLKSGFTGGGAAGSSFATFDVTRTGIASPPAEIPQEAGTTWDVILEQSSDLINWTPANPGAYSGTEPKRFFRTRMVKKP
jgi:hypothetical protein